MKAMKKFLALLLALAMSVALVACGGNSASGSSDTKTDASDNNGADEDYTATLKLAWTVGYDEKHPYTVSAETFKQYVEEKTDGRITVDLYAGGQLGGDADMMEMLQLGTLDVAVTSTPPSQTSPM